MSEKTRIRAWNVAALAKQHRPKVPKQVRWPAEVPALSVPGDEPEVEGEYVTVEAMAGLPKSRH